MKNKIYSNTELMTFKDNQFNKVFSHKKLVITMYKAQDENKQKEEIFTGYLIKTSNLREGLNYSEKNTTHLRFINEEFYNMLKYKTLLESDTVLLHLLDIKSIEIL